MTRLTLGSLVRSALATYREDFCRIVALALVVFVPLSLLETLVEWAAGAYETLGGDSVRIAAVVIALAGTSASSSASRSSPGRSTG